MAEWFNYLSDWERKQVELHRVQMEFHREEISHYANRGNVRMHREKQRSAAIRDINNRLAAE